MFLQLWQTIAIAEENCCLYYSNSEVSIRGGATQLAVAP